MMMIKMMMKVMLVTMKKMTMIITQKDAAGGVTWWRCDITHKPLLLLLTLPLHVIKCHVEGPMDLLEQGEE